MDIVTPAIIAALSVLGEPIVNDAYDKLKTALTKKFSKSSNLVEALDRLEQKPDSIGRREMFREEMIAAEADLNEDVIRAAEALLEKLKTQPDAQQIIRQTVTGDRNVFSGTGDVAVHKKN